VEKKNVSKGEEELVKRGRLMMIERILNIQLPKYSSHLLISTKIFEKL